MGQGALKAGGRGSKKSGQRRNAAPAAPPLFVSVIDAARLLGIGRTRLYQLIDNGDVVSVRVGGRRLVSRRSLVAYHDRLLGLPDEEGDND